MSTATLPTTRHLVYRLILPLEQGRLKRPHLEDLLNEAFEKQAFSAEDRRFSSYLTYGIVRHWFELQHVIRQFSKIPFEKLTPAVRTLLKMGLFQLAFMDSVPDFAAVSTTLNLAENMKQSPKTRGFINAVLQNFIRKGKPTETELTERFPTWWVERLNEWYDTQTVQQILSAQQEIPRLSLRINTLKTTVTEFHEQLQQHEIKFNSDPQHPELVQLSDSVGDPRLLPGFEAGWFLIQDSASAEVGYFLAPQPGESILEIGAAPGTKTSHLATLMNNTGSITAVDISEKRLKLLAENCQRLGVTLALPKAADATQWGETESQYDRILIDAPCSGTGTLGKHPEILLSLKETDLAAFAQTQIKLLSQVFSSLKPGGILVYSTCSITPEENQQVIKAFLESLENMAMLAEEKLVLPNGHHDGFYMAQIRKKEI